MTGWKQALPERLRALLEAAHRAIEHDSDYFVPTGLRTIIELTGRDLLGPHQLSFAKTLEELHRRGFLSDLQLRRMNEVLAGANATVHEGKQHSREAVQFMVLCVEHLLQSAYLLREPHQEL